jgi:phosphatidylglycerol---prolipoprotein diacylglyceryl transferase
MSAYGWLMLAGILLTLGLWWRLAHRDRRLLLIYLAALVGALVGAKIIYLAAEGWMILDRPDKWLRLATGKSILGALLGGYIAVELAKTYLGYTQITGDWFAAIAPLGIILGRIGCWWQGCCPGRACDSAWFTMNDAAGIPRWPAVPAEILFNGVMLAAFWAWRRDQKFLGQHFHIYLIAYGLFRFLHEFLRDSPRWIASLSGYHLAALLVTAWGLLCFQRRKAIAPLALSTKHLT